MKKQYIAPQTVSITLESEAMLAMSIGGETGDVLTNMKDMETTENSWENANDQWNHTWED